MCSIIQNLALWVFPPKPVLLPKLLWLKTLVPLGVCYPQTSRCQLNSFQELWCLSFDFIFFNAVNHFIPSTFWNNSLESINSDEHLLGQETHGHSSTGSFHSLWSLKALQSPFPMNHVVLADICCLDCLEPVPTASSAWCPLEPWADAGALLSHPLPWDTVFLWVHGSPQN